MKKFVLVFAVLFFAVQSFAQNIIPGGSQSFCQGGNIVLTINGVTPGTIQWTLNNGNIPGANNPTYTANAAGVYSATITNAGNVTNLNDVTVSITPNPVVNFTFPAANTVCSGLPMAFTSTVTSGTAPFSYAWDFGDGGSSAVANPSHTFTSLGCSTAPFTVKLVVTDSKGCSNTVTHGISILQAPDMQLTDPNNPFSPFSNCNNSPTAANPNFVLTVNNSSPSAGCIISYSINWGDGNTTPNATFPQTHTYTQLGAFILAVTALSSNSCSYIKTYTVANQSNPAGSLGTLGSTTNLCAPALVPFTISNWTINSPGTTYILNFGDGTSVTLNHPLNATLTDHVVNHTYTTSSCPASSYTATLDVVNACASTPYSAGNIQIRIKPVADFEINPTPACVNRSVCFNNTTTAGSYGPTCSSLATYSWDFGDNSGLNTTQSPCHTYTIPGTYSVTLTSTNPCGSTTVTKQVCITAVPAPGFTFSSNTGCAPLTLTATNTTNTLNSCQTPTYQWSVSYASGFCGTSSNWSFTNGTNATSANPSFQFDNPGTYSINLDVTNACGTFRTAQQVTVKKPPTVSIIPPNYPCGPITITPAAVVTSCGTGTETYAWTFAGGTPATASTLNPGAVSFTSLGAHAITLAVTNECGTTTATESVTVTVAPDVVVPPNDLVCSGKTTGPFTFSSTVGSPPSYNWTNSNTNIGLPASGSGNIAAFTPINNTANPIVATITVTPRVSANCAGAPQTFTITVNPAPNTPGVVSPLTYCRGSAAPPLTATAAGGNSLLWYTSLPLAGGVATAPTPSTATQGSLTYYVTQTNSFNCLSPASSITVMVNPGITGNAIGSNQDICSGTVPSPLTTIGSVNGGSGSFSFQWQSSIDNAVTWQNIPGAQSETFSPPALTAGIRYRRVVVSASCSDTSGAVIIQVQGALTNFNIGATQTICEGTTPAALVGGLPTGGGGGYSYVWESSTDNIFWAATGGITQDYQPGTLTQTTYFRRRLAAAQCSAISNVVTINIDPKPAALLAALSANICRYNTGQVTVTPSVGTAPFDIELTVTATGGATTVIGQTLNNNNPVTITVIQPHSNTGVYTIQLTKITDDKGCERVGTTPSVTITVKPVPVLSIATPAPICSGNNTSLTVSGATTYSWSPAIGLSSTVGSTVTASPTTTTIYTITGTDSGCDTTTSVTVTVTPGSTVAAAGPAQILCNASTATLNGNVAAVGTGSWLQTSGPAASITNATLNNTTVTGLAGGQRYIFKWTIAGIAPCPATIAFDTIDVLSPIVNSIQRDTIICNGQTITITTQQLSGGSTTGLSASYTYQWESAPAATTNWLPIAGETNETLTRTPTANTCYRRQVQSNGNCETVSNQVCVTVNPTISNNIISLTQKICINLAPAGLTGSAPAGGDGNFVYDWQTSVDGITWRSIASTANFQPAVYTTTGVYSFRRNVSSGNCTATSNVITITVKPDAKAAFTATPTISCSPFDLTTAISVTAFPAGNGNYNWYANGALFGSNTTGVFPSYTILTAGDTVDIKLVTTSPFGCKADSITQQFITVITVQARFIKDTGSGCGPLTVNFNNTSNIINNNIVFLWDFGNGVTSTLAQPGSVIFNSSPDFRDTTYQVTLKAYNGCDTTIWRDSIKIRANPKARFGVDTTFGCSPFTILVTNTSLGAPNTYYWDFGNGHRDTTFANGTLSYTYNTGNFVDTFTIQLIAVNDCKRDTQTIDVRVAPNLIRPLINVGGSQLFGCAPHIVSFSNNTTGATSFTWNFGDNSAVVVTNNAQSSVLHTYTTPGTFNVQIDITNGCSDTTVFRTVTVYPKPVALFTTDRLVYCAGDTVSINNTSVDATNFVWFWGDGLTGSGLNPTHIYAASGNYSIYLRAERTNAGGLVCYDTIVHPINVLGKPVVTLQSNINTINCAPFTLQVSAPGIINESVTWIVHDSTVTPPVITLTGTSAQYTFNNPGTFTIKLLAENAAGCKDSSIRTFTVRGKPVASFTPFNMAVCTRDTTISYINTSTYNGVDPVRYAWLVDNVQLATTGNFTHRYNVLPAAILPRVFNTWLIASNTVGCSDTAKAILQMNPLANAQFAITNPNACVPFVPAITNASQFATTYQWLLNGVLTDTTVTPANLLIIQPSTSYTITLIVNNGFDCKADTFVQTFTSRIKPRAAFTVSDTLGCTGVLNVATTNNTTNANSYTWDWGDNTGTTSLTSPTHLYGTQGQYLISLVASDGVCRDTATRLVRVSIKPIVDFSADNVLTCDTARVQLTNLTSNGSTYVWSFGNGLTSTDINPYINLAPSVTPYSIKLVATSAFGCKDSLIKPNLILAKVPPAADFFISPTPVITIPNYTFSFNNLTLNSPNYNYQWSLGDGTFSNSRDIVAHKYLDTGNYPIRLIVLDNLTNCPDTIIKIARIDGFPGYLFVPNAICPGCVQENLRRFIPKGTGLADYRLQIFTTWGELIFETTSLDAAGAPNQAWDGKVKGSFVQQDVYVWKIVAKFKSGLEWLGMLYPNEGKYKKVGTITVVK